MKFTSNGYGRKNGFYFDINYEFYYDGKKAIQPWTWSFGYLPVTPRRSVSACSRDRRNLFSIRSPMQPPRRFIRPLQHLHNPM